MLVTRTKWYVVPAALALILSVAPLSAQERERDRRPDQGGPGGRGGFLGGFGGFGGPAAMLQRTDVQEELELLDDQKKQLADLREKQQAKMRDLFAGLRGGEGDRRDEMRETFRKFAAESQAEVDKVLLPHQSKRLKQLEVQLRMRGGGVMGALDREVAEQLGISEEQRDQLREKARDLDAELRKKTAEIRRELQEQLLASLNEEQRKQFKELIGDPLESCRDAA